MKPPFRDKIASTMNIDLTADELVSALLNLASSETVCILDSCGVGHLGSHLVIAGLEPVDIVEISNDDAAETLSFLDSKLPGELASIFTISYEFGSKLLGIGRQAKGSIEPDVFCSFFDVLIIHDYDAGQTRFAGNASKFDAIARKLQENISNFRFEILNRNTEVTSNFTKAEYLDAIESIREKIRRGDTYQTNLTQQLTAKLPDDFTPELVFSRLRRDHPAPFSAFIKRIDSTVVSASPERFFRVDAERRTISTSPIKGTRGRGKTVKEDALLRRQLLESPKDRAENTMIVDLLRNDLGRVCEYGSVSVERLCDLEEHPTLFHLVSTISGDLRANVSLSDILRALFPCGSITGAPKISTMKIINEIETKNRGLSMGAIGYFIPTSFLGTQHNAAALDSCFDLSVAIRTMVIRDQIATLNVGGGIVIDSDPESEYKETLTKAKAFLDAIDSSSEFQF